MTDPEVRRRHYQASRKEASVAFAAFTGVLAAFVFATITTLITTNASQSSGSSVSSLNVSFAVSLTSFFVLLFSTFLFIGAHACCQVRSMSSIYLLAHSLFAIGGAAIFVMMPFVLATSGVSKDVIRFAQVVAVLSILISPLHLIRAWNDAEFTARGEEIITRYAFVFIGASAVIYVALSSWNYFSVSIDVIRMSATYGAVFYALVAVAVASEILRWDLEDGPPNRAMLWSRPISLSCLFLTIFVLGNLLSLAVSA